MATPKVATISRRRCAKSTMKREAGAYIVLLSGRIIRTCDCPGDAMAFTRALGRGEIYHRSRYQVSALSKGGDR